MNNLLLAAIICTVLLGLSVLVHFLNYKYNQLWRKSLVEELQNLNLAFKGYALIHNLSLIIVIVSFILSVISWVAILIRYLTTA